MAVSREMVLEIVKKAGPLIPAVVASKLGIDLLFAQAFLSELSSKKMVRLSNVKIGGSPLYYVEGQEDRLQNFSDRLNEKDKRTFDLLKSKLVLWDKQLDPLTRVSLRQIKDFAVMLEVNLGGTTEIFWKWYLAQNDKITPLVKQMLGIAKEEIKTQVPIEKKETKIIETIERKEIKPKPIEKKEENIEKIKEKKPEKQEKLVEESNNCLEKINETINNGDEFLKRLVRFFSEKNIEISEFNSIRKNGESEFRINIPSAVGKLSFFCKAKNKKKCNEGDLSSAYVKGQVEKLPILFVTTGEITKKALSMLSCEFNGMKVHKI